MKKVLIVVIILIIAILVFWVFGRQFLLKKSMEGEFCKSDRNCQQNLKCITNICSSGKTGSPCISKNDCQTNFCIKNKCTEGKDGDPCDTSNDCQKISLCKNSKCLGISEQPNEETFKEYFSDMGLGILPPEGKLPMDLQQNVDIFKRGEQICTYGTIIKEVLIQSAIYNPSAKKFAIEKGGYPKPLTQGGFAGCGPIDIAKGKYEYKIYVNDILVALFPFEIID